MTNYEKKKGQARQQTVEWQHQAGENVLSYAELAESSEYFSKLAKRYGLKKEFKENGTI